MDMNEQFNEIARGGHMEETAVREIVPTGSSLLDLIVGGGGYPFGKIVNVIGDSSAGKTLFSCEGIYQAKKLYKDRLKIRYNDAESGFSFDTTELYGFDMRPHITQTPTIQGFASDLQSFCKSINKKKGELGIYVVDSFDGLASDEDIAEFEERLKAHEDDKEYKKGSYDMGKQKFSSKLFRTLSQTIQENNVLLIIISQIRDNIGISFGDQWTVSGGKALKFYSSVRVFLKTVDKAILEGRQIGTTVKCTGIKVRAKYPFRSMFVNILFEYGMDEVSTNIDYLFDLREDYGKLKPPATINNVAWKEDAVDVNSTSLKEFLEERERLDDAEEYIKDKLNGRKSQKNLIEFINSDTDLAAQYVEHFGVIDRDSLIQYIINTEKEDYIAERAVKKWMDVEERIKPVRKRKTLED